MHFWKLIVESNTLNFIILLCIICAIASKFKVSDKLKNAQNEVKDTIDKSQAEKERSELELSNVQKSIENISVEVKEIVEQNEQNVKNLTSKIEDQTKKQISSIKENASKLIDLEETKIFNNLSKETTLACVELARKHIISVLAQKPKYHKKFIKESIEQLNRLNYNEK